MSPMYSALLVVLCALSYTHASSRCLLPLGKANFDATKMSGKWYNIASSVSAHVAHPPAGCAQVDYSVTHTDNHTRIHFNGNVKKGDKTINFELTGEPFLKYTNAVLHTVFKSTTGPDDTWKVSGVLTTSIYATDYTHFAIVYSCKPTYRASEDKFDKDEIMKIWGREPTMDPKLFEVLKNVISGYGLDTSHMEIQDNSHC